MKKFFAMFMAAAMTATMATGCSSQPANNSSSTKPDGDTVKIGVLAPLTGNVAVYGVSTNYGVQMAFEEINAAGGIGGKQVELKTLDEKGDVSEAVNAYNMLVSQDIVALIGDVTSKPTIAVAELAAEDNMPMITATGTAAEITQKGENIFRTCFMDPTQGKAMATFAKDELGVGSVGVLSNPADDYSMGVADAFKSTCQTLGISVVGDEGYGSSDKDFNTQLTSILGKNPDALFISDYYNNVSLMAIQARALGFTGPILGPDGFDGVVGATAPEQVGVLNNLYFTSHYSMSDTAEKVQNFVKGYQAKYGSDPTAFAALGYDTAYIVADAIGRAGSTDPQAIIDALKSTSYAGVTGDITFDANGDSVKSISIITIVEGVYTLQTKVTA